VSTRTEFAPTLAAAEETERNKIPATTRTDASSVLARAGTWAAAPKMIGGRVALSWAPV